MLDLNPSEDVVIDPCCPQRLGKILVAGLSRFRAHEVIGPKQPVRGNNYPDTVGYLHTLSMSEITAIPEKHRCYRRLFAVDYSVRKLTRDL